MTHLSDKTVHQIALERTEEVKRWVALSKELSTKEWDLKSSISPRRAEVLKDKKLCLLKQLLEEAGHEDRGLVEDIKRGFDLTGAWPRSGVFNQKFRPASMTCEDLRKVSNLSREVLLESVQGSGDKEIDLSLFATTLKEVEKGFIQGPINERIETSGNRKMKIEAEMRHGGKIEFIENFAVGAVSHPILCFGKLLRQGWVISKDGSELFMNHPTGAEVPIRLERNSLVMDVQIRAITVEKKEEADGKPHDAGARDEALQLLHREEMRVLALQGFVSRELEQLSLSPGWHVLPNGVAAYSDPVALNFMDPRGNFDVEWPARMTLMKVHDGTGHWVQVENTKDYRATDNPYRKLTADNQPQRTLTFVAPAKLQDYFVSGAEVPVSMYPRMGEEIPDWPDSEDEVGEFVGMGAEGEGAPPGGFEIEMHEEGEMEVMLDEDTLNMDTRLKDLQEWCRKLGLATSGSKMKCLKRLQKFKLLEEQKLAIDLSKRLYEESQREAIPLQVPKLPSRVDQDIHNLTHIPFASWCQCCVATRAKEDARRDEERGDKKDRGKSVISFDYGFTYMQRGKRSSLGHACTWQNLRPKLYMQSLSLQKVEFLWSRSRRRSFVFLWQPAPAIPSFWWQMVRGQHVRSLEQFSIAELNLVCIQKWGQQELTNTRAMGRPRGRYSLWGSWPIVFVDLLKQRQEQRSEEEVMSIHGYRVIAGRTSYEMMFDREYKGKVVLFGESVMYKDVTALKGEAVYKRGVWVGKSFWSDSHIVLTPKGAVESRSIRRLTTQFSADDLVMAKGLPWSFSPQGILMKMKAPTTRRADGVEEAEENAEEKAKQAGAGVALGLVTPGVMGGLSTPVPMAASHTPVPAPGTPLQQRSNPGGVA